MPLPYPGLTMNSVEKKLESGEYVMHWDGVNPDSQEYMMHWDGVNPGSGEHVMPRDGVNPP